MKKDERYFDGLRWQETIHGAGGSIKVRTGLGLPPWHVFDETQADLERLAAGFEPSGEDDWKSHPEGDEAGAKELELVKGCPRDFLEGRVRERYLERARLAVEIENAGMSEVIRHAAAWGRIR